MTVKLPLMVRVFLTPSTHPDKAFPTGHPTTTSMIANVLLFSVCVCICVHVHVCMHVDAKCLLHSMPYNEARSLTEGGAHQFSEDGSQQHPGSMLPEWEYRQAAPGLDFCGGSGVPNSCLCVCIAGI